MNRFNDPFDDDKFDDLFDKPVGTFFKLGLVALILNLIFWLIVIAAVIFGLGLVL